MTIAVLGGGDMTSDAARELHDEGREKVGDARAIARRETLLSGAKPLESMDRLGISDLTREESDAFAAAMGW